MIESIESYIIQDSTLDDWYRIEVYCIKCNKFDSYSNSRLHMDAIYNSLLTDKDYHCSRCKKLWILIKQI